MFSANAAHAQTICGRAGMGGIPYIAVLSVDNTQLLPRGPFFNCQNLFGPIQEFSYTTNYVCVTAQTATSGGNNLVASDCVIQEDTLGCIAEFYYASNGVCTECTENTTAGINPATGHRNTTCAYCRNNYYKSGNTCVSCPDSGKTDTYGTDITACYLPSGSGTDISGTYTLESKCYYTN